MDAKLALRRGGGGEPRRADLVEPRRAGDHYAGLRLAEPLYALRGAFGRGEVQWAIFVIAWRM